MPIGNIWSGISFRHDDSIFVALAEPWRPLSTQSMGRHTRLISDYPMDKTDIALFTLSDNHHSSLLVKSRILWFSVKAVEICGGGNSNVSQCDSRRWPGGARLVNKITRRVRNDYKWPQISNTLDTALALDCCYILSRAATKRREVFTITEKAPTRAFFWLRAPRGI